MVTVNEAVGIETSHSLGMGIFKHAVCASSDEKLDRSAGRYIRRLSWNLITSSEQAVHVQQINHIIISVISINAYQQFKPHAGQHDESSLWHQQLRDTCRTCPWMYKWIDFIQYPQSPSWLPLFYIYSNLGRGAHTLMMYTIMVPQAESDYTFWRERAEVHVNF